MDTVGSTITISARCSSCWVQFSELPYWPAFELCCASRLSCFLTDELPGGESGRAGLRTASRPTNLPRMRVGFAARANEFGSSGFLC